MLVAPDAMPASIFLLFLHRRVRQHNIEWQISVGWIIFHHSGNFIFSFIEDQRLADGIFLTKIFQRCIFGDNDRVGLVKGLNMIADQNFSIKNPEEVGLCIRNAVVFAIFFLITRSLRNGNEPAVLV